MLRRRRGKGENTAREHDQKDFGRCLGHKKQWLAISEQ